MSRLLERVAGGEEIVIAKAGKPVARLVPAVVQGKRLLGQDKGQVFIADDFDAALPEEMLAAFER
ncbi:MAG: type II toxin-antitoxin system prevent-host-death family antitoxin [Acidobacteria bacterium]|nr:MAG: type II toxin-antitoxin system prevent-host-death family antitoxin [Acidobacteriota bacterium]PYR78592.1 MAG: type II toxin-antitoxin system prevent-host-death family antitoxin [Acidobacteriota bacterium]